MTTKRAYKLQEFVAHASSVNCLKIGRKSSRVLLTGGEDHKVNLWAIGKPNSLLSLSGHTSAVESVSFDSSEVLVAAGAASGTIKLWDLEEAKLVRTLTGHRSNCISVDFHPFGEFFASGSLDTNLKIWDIRRKGCIHTYKGHTRGVNAIRFTPDGRWVVSGGEDHVVKLWDLTAGKLLHDFKCHEGQIQCIDFHPHELLLATGSMDKTVKFWDLETFEMIGSGAPDTSAVRSMTFNPDGKTLLCGFHENMKVFSWEPVQCHDAVEVGWSKLSDLNIHEGKLLGCSCNQSCVGIWVVDISRLEPYATNTIARLSNGQGHKKLSSVPVPTEQMDNNKVAPMKSPASQISDLTLKEPKTVPLGTPQKVGLNSVAKPATNCVPAFSSNINGSSLKRTSITTRSQSASFHVPAKSNDITPVVVPRVCPRIEQTTSLDVKKESTCSGRNILYTLSSRVSDLHKTSSNCKAVLNGFQDHVQYTGGCTDGNSFEITDQTFLRSSDVSILQDTPKERNFGVVRSDDSGNLRTSVTAELPSPSNNENHVVEVHKVNPETAFADIRKGMSSSIDAIMVKNERSHYLERPTRSSNCMDEASSTCTKSSFNLMGSSQSCQEETSSIKEEFLEDFSEQHNQFMVSLRSRLMRLQAVRRYWERHDYKGAANALEKMSDHAVTADVISVWTGITDSITLDTCCSLLPVVANLLDSNMDRHVELSLEMILKVVKLFGPIIHATLSASSSVGVDLQAEERLEKCNLCFIELEKVKQRLPALMGKGGSVAKSAQELCLTFQQLMH